MSPVLVFVQWYFLCAFMTLAVSWLSCGSYKAARAASTVLCNMFQYSKLHKDYKLVSRMLLRPRLSPNTSESETTGDVIVETC